MLTRRLGVLGRLKGSLRAYSESVPLSKVHETLKDMETLIAKHKLNEIKSHDKIEELVRNGSISEHIGKQFSHDLRVQQEAGSTQSDKYIFNSYSDYRDGGVLEKGVLVHWTPSDWAGCNQYVLFGEGAHGAS